MELYRPDKAKFAANLARLEITRERLLNEGIADTTESSGFIADVSVPLTIVFEPESPMQRVRNIAKRYGGFAAGQTRDSGRHQTMFVFQTYIELLAFMDAVREIHHPLAHFLAIDSAYLYCFDIQHPADSFIDLNPVEAP